MLDDVIFDDVAHETSTRFRCDLCIYMLYNVVYSTSAVDLHPICLMISLWRRGCGYKRDGVRVQSYFVLHKFYILLSKISWIADRARVRSKKGKNTS